MPILSRNFVLGACDTIMASSEPQKIVFLLWAESKVMETIVNKSFSWGTTKTTFSIKIDNSVTSRNSEWGLVTSSDLENTLLWFNVKTKTWKRIKAIVFQVNSQKPFFKKNWYYCDAIQEWMKALKVFKVALTPFNLDNILFTKFEDLAPSNSLEISFLNQMFKNKSA